MSTGLPMNFVVERQGHDVNLTATPQVTVVDQGVFGKRRMGHLGLASSADRSDAKVERCGLLTCAAWGARAGMVHRQGDRHAMSSGFSPGGNQPIRCRD